MTGDQPANANEAERVGFGKAIKYGYVVPTYCTVYVACSSI